jgi:hypothetical protein
LKGKLGCLYLSYFRNASDDEDIASWKLKWEFFSNDEAVSWAWDCILTGLSYCGSEEKRSHFHLSSCFLNLIFLDLGSWAMILTDSGSFCSIVKSKNTQGWRSKLCERRKEEVTLAPQGGSFIWRKYLFWHK